MARQSKALTSLVAARARLRSAGLRSTGARLAVLRQLEARRGPVTHGELASELAPLGYDRATIYRNLMDLTHAGLVSRTDLGDHVWRFELRASGDGEGSESHPHFSCTDCGTVTCLPGVSVRISARGSSPRAIRRRDVAVQLRGRCDRCA